MNSFLRKWQMVFLGDLRESFAALTVTSQIKVIRSKQEEPLWRKWFELNLQIKLLKEKKKCILPLQHISSYPQYAQNLGHQMNPSESETELICKCQ